jgi:hypothetical protein
MEAAGLARAGAPLPARSSASKRRRSRRRTPPRARRLGAGGRRGRRRLRGAARAHRGRLQRVDLERFHPRRAALAGTRQALGVANGARLCVAIGSASPAGFDLLRLWRERPPRDTTLVLVGDDERLARWRREAEGSPGASS